MHWRKKNMWLRMWNYLEKMKTSPPVHRVHIECFHIETFTLFNTRGRIFTRYTPSTSILKPSLCLTPGAGSSSAHWLLPHWMGNFAFWPGSYVLFDLYGWTIYLCRSRKVVTYTDHRDFPYSSWSDVSDWPVLESIANQGILIIGQYSIKNLRSRRSSKFWSHAGS